MLYQIDLTIEEIFYGRAEGDHASNESFNAPVRCEEKEKRNVRFLGREDRAVSNVDGTLHISVRNQDWSISSSEPSCYGSNESLNISDPKLSSSDLRNKLKRIRPSSP